METPAAAQEGQNALPESAPGQPDPTASGQDAIPNGGEQLEGEPKGSTPKGVQKRLDEMRRQIGDQQRMNDRLLSIVEKLHGGKPADVAKPEGPPKREEYADVEQYLEAKADYQVSQKFAEIEQKAGAEKAKTEAASRQAEWSKRLEKAVEKYPDFEEVALSDSLPVTQAMAMAIEEAESGPDISYWLGKNPAEAKRISTLSAIAQAREIGKIEARLASEGAAQPKKQASKAPAPIDPVSKGKAADSGLRDDLSMDEYVRRRNAELKAVGRNR